jgi:glycosyltransferase involved in cell wall biosynthesis
MKICIDGIGTAKLYGTGLYSYTYELLENLFCMYPQPGYHIIWDESTPVDQWENRKNIDYFPLIKRNETNNLKEIMEYLTGNGIDLFHSLNNGLSIPYEEVKGTCKYVITIHDVIALTNPEMVDDKYLRRFQDTLPKAAEKADRIIAVSDCIKKQLMKALGIPNDKIDVIYPGCANQFRPMDKENCREFIKNHYHIYGDIIFYAGSIHIRKNLVTLMRVFSDIKRNYKDLKLVIAGKTDGKRQEHYLKLMDWAKYLKIEKDLIFVGIVDYKYMPYFYNASRCFINLSDYEGFPMTAVEAVSCRVPTICGNTAPFPEIVGDKAILVNPKHEQEIKDAILEALADKDHALDFMKDCHRIEKDYSWDETIRKHIRLYETLLWG